MKKYTALKLNLCLLVVFGCLHSAALAECIKTDVIKSNFFDSAPIHFGAINVNAVADGELLATAVTQRVNTQPEV